MFEDELLQEQDSSTEVLTFSHPLIMHEKVDIVYQMLSVTSLKQVYFTDSVDLPTIEFIKCLIEFSSNINDEDVEKIVLVSDQSTIKKISTLNYKYPNTWYLSFKNTLCSSELVSVPRYRNMDNYFSLIRDEIEKSNYSMLEKIIKLYDLVKLFKLMDLDSDNLYLPNIIEAGVADSFGFNVLFGMMLSYININSYVDYLKVNGEKKYITIVDVIDNKYNLDGLYMFDPVRDNVSNDDLLNRRALYNFFGLSIMDIGLLKDMSSFTNTLGALSISNYNLSFDKHKSIELNKNNKSSDLLSQLFNCDYKTMHKRLHRDSVIDINTIVSCLKTVYGDTDNGYIDKVNSQYKERRTSLFNSTEIFDE